jgi:phosphoglycolate phosphatase-like HAD superfamily hydrolase
VTQDGAGAVRAIVFDIDGTLLTTGGAGAVAWGRAFNELHGVPARIEDHTEAGMPDHEVCRVTFVNVLGREPREVEIAALMVRYLEHLPDAVAASTTYRILPGVERVLPDLAAAGYLLGLTTGNVEAAAHVKLGRGDLSRFFSFGGYGSDSAHRGELTRKAIERAGNVLGSFVDPASVLVVGDTPRDVEAARYAGAVSVAVATGHFTKEQLTATGADHVLGTLEERLPL